MMLLHAPQSGIEVRDSSAADIKNVLERIVHTGVDPFIVLTDCRRRNRFMQAIKKSPGAFIVEYREGPDGPHRAAGPVTPRKVHAAFVSYSLRDTRFQKSLGWHDITESLETRDQENRELVASHLVVLARAMLVMNRGTEAMLRDSETLHSLLPPQQKRLWKLMASVTTLATEVETLSDHLATVHRQQVSRRSPKIRRR